MIRRRAGDAFGDSYAFPGGVVDADEAAARGFCRGREAGQVDAELGLSGGGLDFYSAAIRELFEETGVLLARDSEGNWAFAGQEDNGLRLEMRSKLNRGELPWASLLQQQKLFIACDALQYFSFWETPLRLPKRWAARFFAAELPPHQAAEHDGSEVTECCWMRAGEILAASRDGSMALPFPTLTTLKALSAFESVDALLDQLRTQAATGVKKIRPVILRHNGEIRFLIPGDPDYPQSE